MTRIVSALLCVLAGCVEVPPPQLAQPPAVDAQRPSLDGEPDDGLDASTPDAARADGAPPDVGALDALVADAALDAVVADAAFDAAMDDAEAPDLARPDAAPPPGVIAWRRSGTDIDLIGPQLLGDIDLAEPQVRLDLELYNGTDEIIALGALQSDNPRIVLEDPAWEIPARSGLPIVVRWPLVLGFNRARISAMVGDDEVSIELWAMGYSQVFVAVGSQATRYVSRDGGVRWTSGAGLVGESLDDVACGGACTLAGGPESRGYRDDGLCVAVGGIVGQQHGLVVYTTDGQRWTTVAGSPPRLSRVAAGDDWYGASSDQVLRADDPRDANAWRARTGFGEPVVGLAATGSELLVITRSGAPFLYGDFPAGEEPLDSDMPTLRTVGAGDGMLLVGGDLGRRMARPAGGDWLELGGRPNAGTITAMAATLGADGEVAAFAASADGLWVLDGEVWPLEGGGQDAVRRMAAGGGRLAGFTLPVAEGTPQLLTRALDGVWAPAGDQPQHQLYAIAAGRLCGAGDQLGPADVGAE